MYFHFSLAEFQKIKYWRSIRVHKYLTCRPDDCANSCRHYKKAGQRDGQGHGFANGPQNQQPSQGYSEDSMKEYVRCAEAWSPIKPDPQIFPLQGLTV